MKKVFLLFCLMIFCGSIINAQNVNVTFQVDMSAKIATGHFVPGTDVVTCPGGFNNWLNEPPANTEKVMSDDDNDSIYTITISMAPSQTYGYKFNVGLGWDGKDEGPGDRSVEVGATDMVVPVSFFDDYAPYTGAAATVIFNIDMQLPAQQSFNPSSDKVYVAGNFTDWGTGAVEMFDTDGDTIYTATVNTLTSGSLAIYKFIYSTGAASSGTWESITEGDDFFGNDKNRIVGIHDGENIVSRNWNNKDPNVTTANGNIFFEVDMSVLTELGVFNPDVDSVQIRGGFNGWNDSDPSRSLLNQNPADPNRWFLDVPFVNQELGKVYYKYYIKNGAGSTQYANTGWEVSMDPTDSGNRDRPIIFEGSPTQEAGLQYFDGIRPEWVIPQGTTVEATFSVDMTYATLADTQGTSPVFNPATDTVFWLPQLPLWYSVHGVPWTTGSRQLVLTDSDQDMIYTGTLTINGPDFNGFMYNYGYSSTTGLIQEAGAQVDHRVRFIEQTGYREFVSPFTMPADVWSNGPKPEDPGPVTSVKPLPGAPVVYALEQNYPNPFNPSTKINFSIPEAGFVTLKVFNLLGEEVATLVNGELTSGTYVADFNASSLSTGIYFYSIKANNYSSTKKMMLVK